MTRTTRDRCTHCGLVAELSAVGWMAHRLDNYATHRGPARYTNNVPACRPDDYPPYPPSPRSPWVDRAQTRTLPPSAHGSRAYAR